ncbi:MAG: ECF transporter S component [Bacteroidia bacterium]|nr:ECF transporter S component [Bacteroidia bacterium]
MKNIKWYKLVGFTVIVTVVTMFVRLPLPSTGYFTFGDVAVVFAGLILGKGGGLIAGGIGSAAADILLGYAVFSPLTVLAKGAEGILSGFAKGKTGIIYWVLPALGTLSMVAIYFGGECLMPQVKFAGAIAELIPNLIQAAGGYIGGKLLFEIYNRISTE